MELKKLLSGVEIIKNTCDNNLEILELKHKASEVKSGDVFFCLNGTNANGEEFVQEAIVNGAVAIVTEHELNFNCAQIVVENCRIAMSQMAKHFYHDACDKLKVIMVTGTNGKTSITYILNSIFNTSGVKCAFIGTNGIYFDNKQLYYGLTTPDPVDLHYYFEQLYNLGAEVVVMEASAHAIKLNKLYGIYGEAVIYTNLTNEHLDFFKTMESYAKTKIDFVNSDNFKIKIVNADDDYARYFNGDNCLFYGLKNPAHTFAVNIKNKISGLNFFVNVMDEILEVNSSLVGLYNVYNLMACVTCAYALNISVNHIQAGIEKLKNIPGRFNVYNLDCNNKIIIDFAHTPDGFEKVLSEIKSFRNGKIITLFGCVGYSDSLKRTEMGKIASEYSSELIITSDNPNFVKFEDIASDITKQVKVPFVLIPDRAEAIEYGFNNLEQNDTLVLLGKGAEVSNLINGVKQDHNDLKAIEKVLEKNYDLKKSEG